MIKTFVLNLKERTDRKEHIENVFANMNDFEVAVLQPEPHQFGCASLWLSLQKITQQAIDNKYDYFIFCEDDHVFTDKFSIQFLKKNIVEATALQADLLLGGTSWLEHPIQVKPNLFWCKNFSGLQFTVIFKSIYHKILSENNFTAADAADYKLAQLTEKKFVQYPFISTQKEFGYSDVTPKNNGTERVELLFKSAQEQLDILNKVKQHYCPSFFN